MRGDMGCYLETPLWGNVRERRKLSDGGGSRLLHNLHSEILDFYQRICPSPQEQHLRASAVSRFQRIAKLLWPSCEVRVFGSFATGLYLPSSDIDLVIFIDQGYGSIKACLNTLADHLYCLHFASHVKVIGTARVPIVKFHERQSGIDFDVSFERICGAMDASRFHAVEMVRQSLVKFPSIGPLYMVLKAFMQQEKLNEVYHTGGMASYTLFVMIKVFLHMHPGLHPAGAHASGTSAVHNKVQGAPTDEYNIEDGLINSYVPSTTAHRLHVSSNASGHTLLELFTPESPDRKRARLGSPLSCNADIPSSLKLNSEHDFVVTDRQSSVEIGHERDNGLGFLLLAFFHFYGACLNSEEYGISCAYGGSFFFKAHQGFYDPGRPHLLAIEDPFTPSRDIGKNSFNYQNIQVAFVEAYECLTCNPCTPNLLHRIVPLAMRWAAQKGQHHSPL